MVAQTERPRVPNGIITQEEANQLVTDALDADMSEPEQFVRMLVLLYDNSQDNYLQEAVYRLIRAAYIFSIAHSFSLQDYMAAIREGRNPLEEARAKEGKSNSRKKH
jgi:hypothetical protein